MERLKSGGLSLGAKVFAVFKRRNSKIRFLEGLNLNFSSQVSGGGNQR